LNLGTATTANNRLHIGFRSSDQMTFAFYANDLNVQAGGDDRLWHHWAFTYDNATRQRTIYRDGELVGRDIATANLAATGPLQLGQYINLFFRGGMDEVRIWTNTVLAQATVQDWMFEELDNTHPNFGALDGYWKFNDGAGSPGASDSSGHGRAGVLIGNPAWSEGTRPALTQVTPPTVVAGTNAALDLNGVTGYVDVPDGVWFNGNFTIELKAFIRAYSTWGRFLDFANGAGQNEVIFSQDGSGRLALYMVNSTTTALYATNQLPLNQWINLAVTVQGTLATLYVDGNIVGSGTVSAPKNVVTTQNWIGRPHWAGETYGNEILDDIRIWNVARTAAEIRAGANGGADPTHPNLLLNYRFNGDSGGVARDSRTVFPRDGQLLGGATIVASPNPMFLPDVSATVSGLAAGARHHFRSSAANPNGGAKHQQL
jgi:hypothetical protein